MKEQNKYVRRPYRFRLNKHNDSDEDASNNKGEESNKPPDWWNRADIISKILSSIVIAAFGLTLTWYIQKTQLTTSQTIAQSQLEAQKIKAENDKKLEEGRITAQLLQHLTSTDAATRELAIVTLRESVPATIYNSVMQVLARTDPNENVRKAALEQLGKSNNANVAGVLDNISSDKKRTPSERNIARQSSKRAAIGAILSNDTYAFAASANEAIDKEGNGLFTYYLLKGLNGEADVNKDDLIAANELQTYLSSQITGEYSGRENLNSTSQGVTRGIGSMDLYPGVSKSSSLKDRYMPVSAFEGSGEVPIWGAGTNYGKIVALIIGVNEYSDKSLPRLPSTINDANRINEILKRDKRTKTQLLINPKKNDVMQAMNQLKDHLKPDDLLIVYFSGHGLLGQDGFPKWLVSDSITNSESTFVSLSIVKNLLDKIQARTKTLYIDACFSRVDELFGKH